MTIPTLVKNGFYRHQLLSVSGHHSIQLYEKSPLPSIAVLPMCFLSLQTADWKPLFNGGNLVIDDSWRVLALCRLDQRFRIINSCFTA